MSDRRVSAILLAAGTSARMGSLNKLTLDVGGVPLVRHSALNLLRASFSEIVVVLGYRAQEARALLDDLPLHLVENGCYREGRHASVRCGFRALREPCRGVMVCLADQPLLGTADVEMLIRAFLDRCPRPVLVPTFRGRRGNPVVFERGCLEARVSARTAAGAPLIGMDSDLVWPFPMEHDHCLLDLDTPEDYARLRSRWS